MASPRPTPGSRPLYLRLRDRIAASIISREYPEGELLPSVRALAASEGANPLTVAKAYQQFQDDGLVEVRRGIGLVVLPGARRRLLDAERRHFVRAEWPAIAARLRLLELDAESLFEQV